MEKIIGLDFDNTIVTYGELFHKYALEQKLIDKSVPKEKKAIRDAIRALPDGNDLWTLLQGHVYGGVMHEAPMAEGLENFLKFCQTQGFRVCIISHKTKFPAMGPKVNLQDAARAWLNAHKFTSTFGINESDIFFVEELSKKLSLIKEQNCNLFVDDLVEVLSHADFPDGVTKILYAQSNNQLPEDVAAFSSWSKIGQFVLEKNACFN